VPLRRPRPRPRPQLARINAMRHSYAADEDDDPADAASAGIGAEFASQTSFRIRGGRGTEVADLFRKLGLSGPEDLTIPPAVYAAAMAHIPNSARRRGHSLELSEGTTEPSALPELPGTSGRDAMVAPRLQATDVGEAAVLAAENAQLQPDVIQVSVRSYRSERTESSSRVVELDTVEASRREVAADVKEEGTANEEKGKIDVTKVDRLRVERAKAVVVETARETTGVAVQVSAESSSRNVGYFLSLSPHRRFKRTITSWLKGQHLGSGSFGSVYEAISE
jgi:mitogen-activated protein kinase kinase kinase 1